MENIFNKIKELYINCLETKNNKIIELINSTVFKFEYAKQKWIEYSEHKIDKQAIINLLSLIEENPKSENQKVLSTIFAKLSSSSKEYELLKTIGELIALLDSKGDRSTMGKQLPPAVANVGVFQTQWIKILLTYKLKDQIKASSILNMINYISNPLERLSIASDDDRKYISRITNLKFKNSEDFDKNLIDSTKYLEIKVNNESNYSHLISCLLYSREIRKIWDPNISLKSYYEQINNNNIWYVKPGDDAWAWDECFNSSLFRFGWDDTMKLIIENNIKDIPTIENLLVQTDKHYKEKNPAKAAGIISKFINDFKNGDCLIACRGIYQIIGFGFIKSNRINYNDSLDENLKSSISVEWKYNLNQNPVDVNAVKISQIPQDTISSCDKAKAKRILDEIFFRSINNHTPESNDPKNHIKASDSNSNKIIDSTKKLLQNGKKNFIFYGPPGTGKTYNTKEIAIRICNNDWKDYEVDLNDYDNFVKESRIKFITFHQSYGYEDFIEGIKPLPSDDKKNVSYDVVNGVFKEFCNKAKEYSISPEKAKHLMKQ